MIVICGTQRSGTSLIARFISECGYDLGTEFWDDRLDGGFENPDVCNFFREFTQLPDFPFKGYWNMIEPREVFVPLASLNLQVVKFSYLLMAPSFPPAWYSARRNQDRFVIMWRPIKDIIKSKNSRPEIFRAEDSSFLTQSERQLFLNRKRSLMHMEKFGMDYKLFDFPVVDDIVDQLQDYTGLSLSQKVWDNLFDKNKIHFK